MSGSKKVEAKLDTAAIRCVLADLDLARQPVRFARSAVTGNDKAIQIVETTSCRRGLGPTRRSYSVWAGRSRRPMEFRPTPRWLGNAEGLTLIDRVAQELAQP